MLQAKSLHERAGFLGSFRGHVKGMHKVWGHRSSSGQQLRSEKPGKSPCPRVRVEIITSIVNTDLLQSLLRLALENGSFPNHFMHVLKTCSESMTKQITELVCI